MRGRSTSAPEDGIRESWHQPGTQAQTKITHSTTWNCENAQTVAIDEFGEIPAKGSRQIQVTSSKTYMVTATSSAGTKRATATVNVRSPRVALIGLGYVSEPLKQAILPSLETLLRAKGYEVAYNPEESSVGNRSDVDYVVQYQISNPEWKSSHTGLPVVSIDRQTVEVHITISLIRQTDMVQLSTAEGVGKASTKGIRTQYGRLFRKSYELRERDGSCAKGSH